MIRKKKSTTDKPKGKNNKNNRKNNRNNNSKNRKEKKEKKGLMLISFYFMYSTP
jgi:hypothetical protein